MIEVYHNPRCSKSRSCLEYLTSKNIKFNIIEYLKEPLSETTLQNIVDKLGIKPFELIRTNEAIYKEQLKGKNLTDEEWIKAMVKNPKLMERPIVVKGNKAVVARPTEKIDSL